MFLVPDIVIDREHRTKACRFMLVIIFAASFVSNAYGMSLDEKKAVTVKAGLVYHLTKLTRWPSSKFSDATNPISLCVIGEDRPGFADTFSRQSKNYTAHGRRFLIRRFLYESSSSGQPGMSESQKKLISQCHILYVISSEIDHFHSILAAVESAGVLTVGEAEQFLGAGGMVSFTIDSQNRIKIAALIRAIEASTLEVSSEFLRHARLVDNEANGLDIKGLDGRVAWFDTRAPQRPDSMSGIQ